MKVKRAKHHVRWLKQQVRRIKNDPHRVLEYPDAQSGGYRYEIKDPAVDSKFGIVVGDAVHNLHTALDHLVWQLAQLNVTDRDAALQEGRQWPPSAAQFPIFKTPKGFKKDGRDKINCLLPTHQKTITDLQPYNSGSIPSSEPLWLLYAISITDKHHVLNASVIDLTEIPDAPFRVISVNPETGEPLHTYRNPDSPHANLGVTFHLGGDTHAAVEAQGKFPVEVAFSDPGSKFGRDIAGQPVVPLMDAAVATVAAIIAEFEPAFA